MEYDLVALGESLIDFTPGGTNALGMQLFARNPGGAPANVLAMFAKLGGSTAFVGKVGEDDFGRFLQKTMEDAGIDVSALVHTQQARTTLAFVQLDEKGDRSFSFYRKPGADILLRPDEVDAEKLRHCGMFHFGAVSLTDEPARSATKFAAKTARQAGALISYDPNYRPLLWESPQQAKDEMLSALPLADIVKVSQEEMELLTGHADLCAGAAALAAHGASLVLVTLGPQGAYYRTPRAQGRLAACDVPTVDTTGAGDAFLGALLWRLRGKKAAALQEIAAAEWEDIVAFAGAAGSLATTKQGAIPALPGIDAIEACMREAPRIKIV